MARILITGARGKTGAPLAALLGERADVEVLGGTGDPARLEADGVRPVAFSWDDPITRTAAALEGVDAVYVVRPDRPDAPELVADLLAATGPRTHVVLLSELDPGYFGPDDWSTRVERAVGDSGRTWTVLRPGWFMQVFDDPRFLRDEIATHGRLPFPGGGRAVSWIDARDIAAVAAHALLEPGHEGRVLDLTGPEALSLPRTAEVLAAGLGRRVEHVELTLEEAVEGSEGFDRANDWGAFDRIRLGLSAAVSPTVEQVTGVPARTLETYVADAWA